MRSEVENPGSVAVTAYSEALNASNHIVSAVSRQHSPLLTRTHIDDGYGDARNYGSAGVLDGSGDAPLISLAKSNYRHGGDQQGGT